MTMFTIETLYADICGRSAGVKPKRTAKSPENYCANRYLFLSLSYAPPVHERHINGVEIWEEAGPLAPRTLRWLQ